MTQPELFRYLFATLSSVFKHVRVFLNYVPLYGTLWGFAIASQVYDPCSISKESIAKRLSQFSLNTLKCYDEKTHFSMLTLPQHIRTMLTNPGDILETADQNTLFDDPSKRPPLYITTTSP